MTCDKCGARRGHLPGCESAGGSKAKRGYTRRGPVCPECGATMDVNPETGQAHCPFAGSHENARKIRNDTATRTGNQRRGRPAPENSTETGRKSLRRGRPKKDKG